MVIPEQLEKQEMEVRSWIEAILDMKLQEGTIHEVLKDGVILCQIINKISPTDGCRFPSLSKASFVQMENISYFIDSARQLGVPDSENFSTVDLFEGKNIKQVMVCLSSLSRNLVKGGRTDLPVIGPRLVDTISIHFSKEQLDDAKRAVSLQYGYIGEQSAHK